MSATHDMGIEAAKLAPPAAVVGASWLGFSLNELIQIMTALYLVTVLILQVPKLYRLAKSGWGMFSSKRGGKKRQGGYSYKAVLGGTAGLGAVLALAAPLIMHFEGKENATYVDPVGIATICYGHTATARPGMVLTDEECHALLDRDMRLAIQGVAECVDDDVVLEPIQWAALTSWTYNVGIGNACRSTLLRRINAGEPASAWCGELTRWVYAGGRKLKGLERRRKAEKAVCEGGDWQ